MSNSKLSRKFQPNIFIFEARASLQTLSQSLKQNSNMSARLGTTPKLAFLYRWFSITCITQCRTRSCEKLDSRHKSYFIFCAVFWKVENHLHSKTRHKFDKNSFNLLQMQRKIILQYLFNLKCTFKTEIK